MHICPCSQALGICKNIGIRTYFDSVTAKIMGFFRRFAFCSLGNRLASFFIVPKNCILWGTSFELIKKLGNFVPQKVIRFSWNPPIPSLLHPTGLAEVGKMKKTRVFGGKIPYGLWRSGKEKRLGESCKVVCPIQTCLYQMKKRKTDDELQVGGNYSWDT